MSSYKAVGGALKLKGGPAGPENKKKKKKSKSSASDRLRGELEVAGGSSKGGERADSVGRGSDAELDAEAELSGGKSQAPPSDGKTDAQRRFEAVQRQRMEEKARKAALKTHKDRVAEFNDKLQGMSEHYDIPKVGPG